MNKYYIIEKICYYEGFPVVEFAECKYLQNNIYNSEGNLNFINDIINSKHFNSQNESLQFIKDAIIKGQTTIENNICKYYIVECNLEFRKKYRLNVKV